MKQGVIAIIFIAIITTILIMANYIGINETINVKFTIVDSFDQKIVSTKAESSEMEFLGDIDGEINISLKGTGPDVIMVSAPGYLTEAVPIGFEDNETEIKIKLLSDSDGKRVVMNFGGDVIFGRRYLEKPLEPGLSDSEMSKVRTVGVVENLYRAFSNADISYINFESVIGNLNSNDAYKNKIHLIQSPIASIYALDKLGVDLVSLANNHIRDWGDEGVDSTIQALKMAGIKSVGAGNAETASQPVIITKNGINIGNLAYTTVTGSYVNDFLPRNFDPQPISTSQDDNWKWEMRTWGWASSEWNVPTAGYRIGEVWAIYSDIKPKLTTTMQSKVWASISSIYPELLSFVAENGQLGAAAWDSEGSSLQIQELRPKVDILVVQIHGGYQYKSAPSSSLVNAAHAAIDAGADIVISHHPHVLQGMEWYKGHLIVYSLGNLAFDQDFLDTFQTGFLRTVWENGEMIQSRFIPVEIVDYYPTLVADKSAKQIISQVWEKSQQNTKSIMKNNIIYPIANQGNLLSKPAQFRYEWGTARISEEIKTEIKSFVVEPGETILLDQDSLWPSNLGLTTGTTETGIMIGRDLFRWGSFEDTLADASIYGGIHMKLGMPLQQWKTELNEETRNSYISISRKSTDSKITLIRTLARTPLVTNRIFSESLVPLDPSPEYSIRLHIKKSGDAKVRLRVDSYWFYDSNPVEDPISELLDQRRYEIKIEGKGWETIEIPVIPASVEGKTSNSILVYFEMDPPSVGNCSVDIDDLEIVEWRESSKMPNNYGAFTHIKNTRANPVNLNMNILSSKQDILL